MEAFLFLAFIEIEQEQVMTEKLHRVIRGVPYVFTRNEWGWQVTCTENPIDRMYRTYQVWTTDVGVPRKCSCPSWTKQTALAKKPCKHMLEAEKVLQEQGAFSQKTLAGDEEPLVPREVIDQESAKTILEYQTTDEPPIPRGVIDQEGYYDEHARTQLGEEDAEYVKKLAEDIMAGKWKSDLVSSEWAKASLARRVAMMEEAKRQQQEATRRQQEAGAREAGKSDGGTFPPENFPPGVGNWPYDAITPVQAPKYILRSRRGWEYTYEVSEDLVLVTRRFKNDWVGQALLNREAARAHYRSRLQVGYVPHNSWEPLSDSLHPEGI